VLTQAFIPAEIRLDLEDAAKDKVGELTMYIASSAVSISDAIENANQAAAHLGPGPAIVNNTIQATAPLATEIAAQHDAWQPLLSRLEALMRIADAVAEVRFILNHLCPVITKYFQTGSPLDQISMGSRQSSV
jgi:ABC-type transporter Mla subunit MlaD